MEFSIPVATIKALLMIAQKNDIRYYLNGICFDCRTTDSVAVVTDGHMMLAVPIAPEGTAEDTPYTVGQFIVPRSLFDNMKLPKASPLDMIVRIDVASGTVTILYAGQTVSGKLGEGIYPDWRRGVPTTATGEPAHFNTELLMALHKANLLLGGKFSPYVRHNGASGTARVDMAGNAVAVIMPLRWDSTPMHNPGWLSREPAAGAKAA